MIKKVITILVIILLAVGAVLIVKHRKQVISKTPRDMAYPIPVTVYKAKHGELIKFVHYLGTVKPINYADISSRVLSSILSVNVREGDYVKKGELLISLDASSIDELLSSSKLQIMAQEDELLGAKGRYEAQNAIYQRNKILFNAGAISKEKFQLSKASKDTAKSSLENLKARILSQKKSYFSLKARRDYTKIYAPMDGVITARLGEPGEMAAPGKLILKIEGTHAFKVLAKIPQNEISSMRAGEEAVLKDGNKTIFAAIGRIYPAVSDNTLGTIEIDIKNRPFNIPSGGVVDVEVRVSDMKGIIVPINSILENPSSNFVFAVNDGRIKIIPIKIIGKNDRFAAIKGIKSGQEVVVGYEGLFLRLHNGQRVQESIENNNDNS